MTFRMSLPRDRYPDAAAMTRFYRDAVRAVQDLPGVQSAAVARYLPQNHETVPRRFVPPADPGRPIEDRPRAVANWVDAGYFATMDIRQHARRLHESLAARALSQLKMVGFEKAVVFIGGVALQEGMVAACRDKFGKELLVPDHPAHVVAFGAAILGLQRYLKRHTASATA